MGVRRLSRGCLIFFLISSLRNMFALLSFTDDLGGTSPLQLLQDDFESSDQEIRLKALKRVKLVADVLGPEVTRSELIPFINSECELWWAAFSLLGGGCKEEERHAIVHELTPS